DALFAETVDRMDDQDAFGLIGTTQVLWVNFDGANLQKGFGRGQSFILCRSSATVPAAGLSPADREAIVEMVQAHYAEAKAALVVTQERPAGDFTTIHVGGSYADLGCVGAG